MHIYYYVMNVTHVILVSDNNFLNNNACNSFGLLTKILSSFVNIKYFSNESYYIYVITLSNLNESLNMMSITVLVFSIVYTANAYLLACLNYVADLLDKYISD